MTSSIGSASGDPTVSYSMVIPLAWVEVISSRSSSSWSSWSSGQGRLLGDPGIALQRERLRRDADRAVLVDVVVQDDAAVLRAEVVAAGERQVRDRVDVATVR